jgi:flagellar protein FliJ
MKRFQFNLTALLRLYARDEEEKKRKLGEANRIMLLAEQELQRLGNEYDECQHRETEVREKGETLLHMKLYITYMFDLKHRIERQKVVVRDAAKQVRIARDRLIEAKRRVKSIERIKEKRFLLWKKERNRFEAKFLDDVCQQKFIRERAEAALLEHEAAVS